MRIRILKTKWRTNQKHREHMRTRQQTQEQQDENRQTNEEQMKNRLKYTRMNKLNTRVHRKRSVGKQTKTGGEE